VLCTEGWVVGGPVSLHVPPESVVVLSGSFAGLLLVVMTERLRADAVGRSAGALRDDLVLLAIRPLAASDTAETPQELAVGTAE
ncbi:MAG: hypothetical protein ACTHO8_10415, partial [Solirubrobacterales bacterium]